MTDGDPLSGRAIRVGVVIDSVLAEELRLSPGSGITVGPHGSDAHVRLERWTSEPIELISPPPNRVLRLGPGMRVHMCHDEGEDRLIATFEQRTEQGLATAVPVRVSKLNIRLGRGLVVLVQFELVAAPSSAPSVPV